jgi:hypothetical protein
LVKDSEQLLRPPVQVMLQALYSLRISKRQHSPVTLRALRLLPVSLPSQVIAQVRQEMPRAH